MQRIRRGFEDPSIDTLCRVREGDESPRAERASVARRIVARLHGYQWRLQARIYCALAERRARALSCGIDGGVRARAHGSGGGTYHICPDGLSPASIVYSFGIGCDTSFESSLIEAYGLTVFAFDPTDESRRYLDESPPPKAFVYSQCGLAAEDGRLQLNTVKRGGPRYRAGTILDIVTPAEAPVEVEVRALRSLMRERHHTSLDILKLDIEGAEFEVLESLFDDGIPAQQLVLEFHPHLVNLSRSPLLFWGPGWPRTEGLIERIRQDGFELIHVSRRGTEFSFRRPAPGDPDESAA